MRVTIVQNPRSGEESLHGSELVSQITNAGHRASYASTEDHAAVAQHLHDPGDLVVVAGGDGTIRDVARRLLGHRVPLTVIPTGTANNIARTLGIRGDARDLIAGWDAGTLVPFDTALVRGICGPRAVLEGCGLGPIALTIAALSQLTDDEARALWADHEVRRDLKVLREIVADHPTYDCQIQLDGKDLSGEYFLVEVMNIKSVGPNVELAPDASISDGLFDVILMTETDRVALRDYLTARLEGDRPRLALDVKRGCEFQLVWPGSRLHIDDEVWPNELDATTGTYREGRERIGLEVVVSPDPLEFLIPRME